MLWFCQEPEGVSLCQINRNCQVEQKSMKTELFTVSKIFHETLFRIPDYQRGYSWEESHFKDFWADIEQLADGKSHYTGVLTLEAVPEAIWSNWTDDTWIIKSRRYDPYYVVDGQQRLTTVAILLQCIVEKCDGSDLNFTPIDAVRRKYIFDKRADSLARAYIFGYEKDNPSYEYLKTRVFGEHSDRHSTNETTIYTRNLRNAKLFFTEKVSSLSQEQVEILFTKLTQQLVFNVYEISKEIDVFVAFETMNNRGKPLSALELLKNRLIYLATQIPEAEEGDGKQLRRVINDAWKTVYHNLGKNENRPLADDEFLRTHLSYFYHHTLSSEVPTDDDKIQRFVARSYETLERPANFLLARLFTRKRLTGDAKDDLRDIDAPFLHQYAGHLKKTVEVYFNLSTPAATNLSDPERIALERIGRLRGYGASALMVSVFLSESSSRKRASFLETYERFLFCVSLKSGHRFGYSQRYVQLEAIKYIKGKLTLDELVAYFNNNVNQLFKDDTLADALHDWMKNGPGYYGWRGINYFLYEYELSLAERSKTARAKIDWASFAKEDFQTDYSSIEHIYPQKARAAYWSDRFGSYSTAQRRMLRNSLGNLLALSKPKNSSLSNKPFPDKIGREGDTVGYRYGGYSENEVAASPEWGPQEIVERGIKMISFLSARWRLPIGDRTQQAKALGLLFATKK